ncbi:DNA-protecting protein DprA [Streptomyces althioticus]|uniref:DNA-protecting protein DprA n=1 Tax=Streptomyces althioticus TaxID=83380 RepID=A0ABZ1Y490_9ACTN|nr:DNA-processing protein DprA [Streptomyces coelicoflavus]MDI6519098.1 DNA-processing protein DprA [Streptomyces coelicoflavus]
MITDDQMRLLALCSIRVEGKSVDWSLIARCTLRGHLDALCDGQIPEESSAARKALPILRHGLRTPLSDHVSRIDEELRLAEKTGARLTTVLDSSYPENLRSLQDLPPFLFFRGNLVAEADKDTVAVVGTRDASDIGLSRAKRVARELGEAGFTISSGLARGIDTAAHETALHFERRTLAVLGTGITRCYPKENAGLLEEITQSGAVLSQFWPSRSPGRDTFPRRNHVTSGISLGSVVIEASRTSGAKMQARVAAEQGRHVLLLRSLVDAQEWARKMVEAGRATTVDSTAQIIEHLRGPSRSLHEPLTEQLRLDVG